MPKKDATFELIKSLTKSEKRYFSLFAARHQIGEKNIYLKLFEAIDKQTNYDEEKLLHSLVKSDVSNNFTFNKHYLYKLILKSLHSFHSGISKEAELKENLHQIEILFDKGLYEQCKKIVRKATVLAEMLENYLHLLELLGWEIELMRIQSYRGISEMEMKKVYEKIYDTIDKYKNINEVWLLSSQMDMKVANMGYSRNPADLKEYENIIRNPLLKSEKNAQSFSALHHFYLCYFANHFIRNNHPSAYKYAEKSVKLMEANPHQIEEKPIRYINALFNIIICELKLKYYQKIPENIKKLKNIKTKSASINNKLFYTVSNLELELLICSGEFQRGAKLVNEIQQKLRELKDDKQHRMLLEYNISVIYLGAGNFVAANASLNKLLNDPDLDSKSHIYCFARVLGLIIHFELAHYDLLKYIVKSTYGFLYKRKRLYKFETIILNFIKNKLPKTRSPKGLLIGFKELKKEIETLKNNTFENNALEFFDLISWLESKIENRPFAEIVKEKFLNQQN